MDDEATGSALARWRRAALALSSHVPSPGMPLFELYGEAADVARFHATYFRAERDESGRLLRRGLEQAVLHGSRRAFGEHTGEEILSLVEAVQEAHVSYLLLTEPLGGSPVERARIVLSELTAALEWHFEDGLDEDEPRSRAPAREDEPETVESLATALEDYAALAEPHRAALDGVGGFDARLVDEAHALASALRELEMPPHGPEAAAALALRGRMIALLLQRMNLVRAAARFVFRDEPEILREAASAYERRGRAATRRAAARRAPGVRAAAPSEPSALEPSPAH